MIENNSNPDDEQARWEALGAALVGADMAKLRMLLDPIEHAHKDGAAQPFGDMAMELYYNLRDHVYGVPWDLPADDE